MALCYSMMGTSFVPAQCSFYRWYVQPIYYTWQAKHKLACIHVPSQERAAALIISRAYEGEISQVLHKDKATLSPIITHHSSSAPSRSATIYEVSHSPWPTRLGSHIFCDRRGRNCLSSDRRGWTPSIRDRWGWKSFQDFIMKIHMMRLDTLC